MNILEYIHKGIKNKPPLTLQKYQVQKPNVFNFSQHERNFICVEIDN